MYPAIANGTSIVQGARTKAGEACKMVIDLGGSADQQNAIQAASWLLSIGDWHKKNVSGTMVVRGRRLSELILGSKTDAVTISITGLTLADCGSMQKILLSNIASLQGTLDLGTVVNIREIYADGTNLSQIKLPNGGGLEVIEYPANNKYITFRNFPKLTTGGLVIGQCAGNITDFLIENCPLLSPMQLLSAIIKAQQSQGTGHALKHIRAVGFDETFDDSDMLDKLAILADGTYEGLSSEGLAGEDEYPVLDGTITVNANTYEDSIETLRNTFRKLTLNINGEFYVRFRDAIVQSMIAESYGDGVGTKIEQVKAVTNFSGMFKGNTEITSFDEFELFTGYNSNGWNVFDGCLSLISVKLPSQLKIIYGYMFYDCRELANIDLRKVEEIQRQAFYNTGLTDVDLENVVTIAGDAFSKCTRLFRMKIGDKCGIPSGFAMDCTSLVELDLGAGVNAIAYAFQHSPLRIVTIRAVTPPEVTRSFQVIDQSCRFYVPDESVETYKAASGWSQYTDKIYPLSQKTE